MLYRATTAGAVTDGPDDQTAIVTLRLSVAADAPVASATAEMRTDAHGWEAVTVSGGSPLHPQVTVPRDDFYVFRVAVTDSEGRTSFWLDTPIWCYIPPAANGIGTRPADNPTC